MSKKQVRVVFKGYVQGVGFRYTVERLALSLGIAGWVKNLDSGNVEVVAESDEEIINDFLERIRSRFSRYIRNEEVEFSEPTGKLQDFDIRF